MPFASEFNAIMEHLEDKPNSEGVMPKTLGIFKAFCDDERNDIALDDIVNVNTVKRGIRSVP